MNFDKAREVAQSFDSCAKNTVLKILDALEGKTPAKTERKHGAIITGKDLKVNDVVEVIDITDTDDCNRIFCCKIGKYICEKNDWVLLDFGSSTDLPTHYGDNKLKTPSGRWFDFGDKFKLLILGDNEITPP